MKSKEEKLFKLFILAHSLPKEWVDTQDFVNKFIAQQIKKGYFIMKTHNTATYINMFSQLGTEYKDGNLRGHEYEYEVASLVSTVKVLSLDHSFLINKTIELYGLVYNTDVFNKIDLKDLIVEKEVKKPKKQKVTELYLIEI